MQPSGNMPQPREGTTFKRGPDPQPSGAMTPPVVHVGGLGPTVVRTGDANTAHNSNGPRPGA